MNRPPLFQALEPVVHAFEILSAPYCLGGSVASSALGTARTTLNVDLVADLKQGHTPGFVAQLANAFYASETAIAEAIARKGCFNVIHLATMFKVDVFAIKARAFDRVAFQRRTEGLFSIADCDRRFFHATPEDIILYKLEWYRLGDEVSERQWQDVLGVLRVQRGRLDLDYLRNWAAELGISDLFERIRHEAEPSSGQPDSSK